MFPLSSCVVMRHLSFLWGRELSVGEISKLTGPRRTHGSDGVFGWYLRSADRRLPDGHKSMYQGSRKSNKRREWVRSQAFG